MCLLGGELGNGGPARHLGGGKAAPSASRRRARGSLTPRAHYAAIKIQLQSGINIDSFGGLEAVFLRSPTDQKARHCYSRICLFLTLRF